MVQSRLFGWEFPVWRERIENKLASLRQEKLDGVTEDERAKYKAALDHSITICEELLKVYEMHGLK